MQASRAEGDGQSPTTGLAKVRFVGYLRQLPHVAGPQRKESEDQRKNLIALAASRCDAAHTRHIF